MFRVLSHVHACPRLRLLNACHLFGNAVDVTVANRSFLQWNIRLVRLHRRRAAAAERFRRDAAAVPVRVEADSAEQRFAGAEVLEGVRGVSAQRVVSVRVQRGARGRYESSRCGWERHRVKWVDGEGSEDGGGDRRRLDPDAGSGGYGGELAWGCATFCADASVG